MATPTAEVEPTPTATLEPTATPVEAEPDLPAEISWVDNPDCESVNKSPLSSFPVNLSWREKEEIVSSEVAASSTQRSQGLMCRWDVQHGSGMLFLFDLPRDGGFWMFNTYVPLDILYIDSCGKQSFGTTPCNLAAGKCPSPTMPGAADVAPGRAGRILRLVDTRPRSNCRQVGWRK